MDVWMDELMYGLMDGWRNGINGEMELMEKWNGLIIRLMDGYK
jgi:hypothetical protein